jgi:hypothetical protein
MRLPIARAIFARAETAILALLFVIGLVAWPVGPDTVEYDFAEVMRAHSVRLAAEALPKFLRLPSALFRVFGPITVQSQARALGTVGHGELVLSPCL